MRLLLFIIITLSVIPSFAFGCSFAPVHMYQTATATIDDAEWIARVKGISWERKSADGSRYTAARMDVIEYLKGEGPEEIFISPVRSNGAHGDGDGKRENNYSGHTDTSFWLYGGRSGHGADCKIHPSILVDGSEYIVFGPKDYNFGYENISGHNDAWLKFVTDYLADKKATAPLPLNFENYLQSAEAVVRFKVSWNKNGAVWSQEVLSGDDLDYAAMLYASPNGYFSDIVNPNCNRYGASEKNTKLMDQIVVFERLPMDEIRTYQSLACAGSDYEGNGSIEAKGVFSERGHAIFELQGVSKAMVRLHPSRFDNDFIPDDFYLSDLRKVLQKK